MLRDALVVVDGMGATVMTVPLGASPLRTNTIANVAQSVEGYEPKIAPAPNGLRVSDAVANAVVRIDPQVSRIAYRRARGGAGVAVSRFGVWSTDSFNYVWRVAGGRLAKVRTGSGAIDVAADKNGIWVVNRFSRTLVRVDARLRIVRRIRISRPPITVAAGGGYVGVAVR